MLLWTSPLTIPSQNGRGLGSVSHLSQTSVLTTSQWGYIGAFAIVYDCDIYTHIDRPNSQTWCPALCLAWVKQRGGTMLAPKGWGKNLAPLSRHPLTVILQWVSGLQRHHECSLDEKCSHRHTTKCLVSALGPHAWPIIPAAERNWAGPPFRSLSVLVNNQPRVYSEWLEALTSTPPPHQLHCPF